MTWSLIVSRQLQELDKDDRVVGTALEFKRLEFSWKIMVDEWRKNAILKRGVA